MPDSLERLYDRYRSRGDTRALAEIFERTAPRLLALAIHLVGDVAAAEDLVQSTFVTAIESSASFDSTRALEPWLAGILTNRARELRRASQRTFDLDRFVEHAQQTPLERAQAAEFSGTLAQAIDKLPEPYRRALLLRLRHGMKPADIAHALDESPGAIRVRIHRGIEMLKQHLPAGFALRALLAVEPARGLASIEQAVVSAATAHVATVSSVVVLGGIAMSKKVVALGAAMIFLLLAWWAREAMAPADGAAATPDALARGSAPVAEVRADDALVAASDVERKAALADEPAPAAADLTPVAPVRGKVIDGETGAPIAGALVQLYPPRRARLSEIKRRWPDRIVQAFDGSVSARGSWPWLPRKLSDAAAADAEDALVCDPPLPGTAACASAVTDATGAFDLLGPASGGFLVCESAGHETRQMPAPRAELRSSIEDGGERVEREIAYDALVVRMWRMRPLSGYVVGEDGERIHRSFKLRFFGTRPGDQGPDSTYDPAIFESWTVETRADGTFSAQFAAPRVQVESCEADWTLTNVGIHPTKRQRWVFSSVFAPGDDSESAILVARRLAALRVTDAATHAPIESIVLHGRGGSAGIGFEWRGRFYAPHGHFKLIEHFASRGAQTMEALRQRFTFTVWADGYLPRDAVVENLTEAGEVLVELERGEPPAVAGRVLEAGEPLAGTSVGLIPLLHTSWRADQTGVTSSARCDADGRFELHAPAGMYLLRCTSGARTHCEGVTVPTSAPLVIDFARAASLVVQLRDRHGAPVAGYVIALQSADGRSTGHMSDVDGRVEFADLSAGDYTLAVAPKPGVWSWGRSQNQPIALRDGEQRVLELTLPAGDPRYAQLFVEGAADTTGWRARDGSLPDQAWTDVRADGVIPIDIRSGIWMLDIENAPQQRWEVFIPEDAPDGFPIHIEIAERGYEGRVVQYGTSKPARGMRITAVPRGLYSPERTLTSVVTDEDGRFRLAGLEADRFALELTRSDQLGHRYGETNRVRFVPDEAPSTPPRVLTIGVPSQSDGHWSGFAERKVSGQVRLAGRDGAGITVEIEAHIATADGHLSIRHSLARGNSDENGKYALTSLVATSYSATLFDAKSRKVSQTFEWSTSSGSDVEVHNFEFE